jgi:hypothetical protein
MLFNCVVYAPAALSAKGIVHEAGQTPMSAVCWRNQKYLPVFLSIKTQSSKSYPDTLCVIWNYSIWFKLLVSVCVYGISTISA